MKVLHERDSSYGALTFSPVGLSPTEHASLPLDALVSKNTNEPKTRAPGRFR